MVFQDPMTSLNPVMRVGEQMVAPMMRHLDLSKVEARERAVELLARSGSRAGVPHQTLSRTS
jgi:ABC-type microcin C transport system duplicated ATPase subunit YejF